MALQRHRKTKNNTPRKQREESIATLAKRDVGAKIELARKRRAAELKAKRDGNRIPPDARRPIPGKGTKRLDNLRELQAHGFRTSYAKGKTPAVIIDAPRDKRRQKIKGAKVEVLKGGIVKMSVKQRRDIIYGFTKKEKQEFAKDPDGFTKKKLRELSDILPSLRNKKKKQVRLQWGAYQGQKDFAPTYWSKFGSGQYFNAQTPEMKRVKAKGKLKDRLTGLHIVIHVPKSKQKGKRAPQKTKGKKK